MTAKDVAFGVLTGHVVNKDILGDDNVTFHSHHLGDVSNFAGAVAQACGLNDHID